METQPTIADDAEQQWIAKYRRAIEANIPVARSRSAPLRKRITGAFETVVSSVGTLFEQCIRAPLRHAKTTVKHSARQIDLPNSAHTR